MCQIYECGGSRIVLRSLSLRISVSLCLFVSIFVSIFVSLCPSLSRSLPHSLKMVCAEKGERGDKGAFQGGARPAFAVQNVPRGRTSDYQVKIYEVRNVRMIHRVTARSVWQLCAAVLTPLLFVIR